MSNFDYSRGYSTEELEELLSTAKIEREKYLQSFSDSGSSASRISLETIERKIGGILDALEVLLPEKYAQKSRQKPRLMGIEGGVIQ